MGKYIRQADFCIFPDKEGIQSLTRPHEITTTGSFSYYIISFLAHLKLFKGLSVSNSLGAVFSVLTSVLLVVFSVISYSFS